ncbi:group XIIA secretory phospholipase A2-like [Amphiura filiformis]|uniref:group XIIA secretory phospholipase A2-like n=1 Tax=Amphiura filiformis TaxID=82378 RepID=UPI003B213799
MEIYSQLVQFSTILLILFEYSNAVDNVDDFGDADLLLNTLASAFVNTDGVGDNAGNPGECKFTCPNGAKPKKNPNYVAISNGCGAYGLKIDLSKLPNIEKCCSRHDVCYGTCNKKMSTCDDDFNRCLNNMCEDLMQDMDLTEEEAEGCKMVAQLMYTTVQGLGCSAYLEGQKEACSCTKMSNKTRKNEL